MTDLTNNDTKILRIGQSGFSLVELLIVIVIVGILASVGVPLYRNNLKKVKLTEADSALASIRDHLTVYRGESETLHYPVAVDGEPVLGADWNVINDGELNGKYFAQEHYSYVSQDGESFQLICEPNGILDSQRILDQNGDFSGGLNE
jgi:prepilin-type N-terminal cleavage/methylation domain-containing protein